MTSKKDIQQRVPHDSGNKRDGPQDWHRAGNVHAADEDASTTHHYRRNVCDRMV